MDPILFNREAWDKQVDSGSNVWTMPVSSVEITKARGGEISVLLTETKPVPNEWFPPLKGLRILGLASGGGQQGPLFAAAGADVTIFDNSPKQLEQDEMVAEREGLTNLRAVLGDAKNLSMFADESFDLIFHPASNVFMPDVRPVWKEAYRVLRHGGTILSGMMNPVLYLFEEDDLDAGNLVVKQQIPYADTNFPERIEKAKALGYPLEYGHTLTDLIGGQIDAGFQIIGFYEDFQPQIALSQYTATYVATRSLKP